MRSSFGWVKKCRRTDSAQRVVAQRLSELTKPAKIKEMLWLLDDGLTSNLVTGVSASCVLSLAHEHIRRVCFQAVHPHRSCCPLGVKGTGVTALITEPGSQRSPHQQCWCVTPLLLPGGVPEGGVPEGGARRRKRSLERLQTEPP